MFSIKNKTLAIVFISALFPILEGCDTVAAGTAVTGASIAQDRRSVGTLVDDKSIQLKAKETIEDIGRKDPAVHVSAICYNNSVLLVGQVPSERMRTEMQHEIARINKVRNVNNEITVQAPTSMLTRSSDSLITTKIKSEMAVTQDINPNRIKVVTEDGIVYLMGIVKDQEDEIAVDIARHTKGAKKVVKIFDQEY